MNHRLSAINIGNLKTFAEGPSAVGVHLPACTFAIESSVWIESQIADRRNLLYKNCYLDHRYCLDHRRAEVSALQVGAITQKHIHEARLGVRSESLWLIYSR